MSVAIVHVVVPAHDEEQLLGRCLASLRAAAEDLDGDVAVRTTVVLDRCTDGSAEIAASYGADLVAVDAACVGVARAAGVDRVAALAAGHDPRTVLVATTDADSVVPVTWLRHLRDLVAVGHELVVGAVRPDPADVSGPALARWTSLHHRPAAHVHGANLAFTLAAYERVGGFPPVGTHEDVLLVAAMRSAGCRWTTGTTVLTSGRTVGRAPGGFAAYVGALVAETGCGQS